MIRRPCQNFIITFTLMELIMLKCAFSRQFYLVSISSATIYCVSKSEKSISIFNEAPRYIACTNDFMWRRHFYDFNGSIDKTFWQTRHIYKKVHHICEIILKQGFCCKKIQIISAFKQPDVIMLQLTSCYPYLMCVCFTDALL